MKWTRTGAGVGIVIAAVVSFLAMSGCVPHRMDGYDGPTRKEIRARKCMDSGHCTPIIIENQGFSDAKIYLNGYRFGEVMAVSVDTLYVGRPQLDPAGCVTLLVQLPTGQAVTTNRECVVDHEWWVLRINPLVQTSTLTRTRV